MRTNRTRADKMLSDTEIENIIEKIADMEEERLEEAEPKKIIDFSKKMHAESLKIKRSKPYIHKRCQDLYIGDLIDYGYYAKGNREYHYAQILFSQALRIDPKLPLVHYRLGHIHFKREQYAKAINGFEEALGFQKCGGVDKKYLLDGVQLKNAQKVLAYCALKVFHSLRKTALTADAYGELDPFIRSYLEREETDLSQSRVKMHIRGRIEPETVSYEWYSGVMNDEEWVLGEAEDCLILDGYADEKIITYKRRDGGEEGFFPEKKLKIDSYSFLKTILLEEKPELAHFVGRRTPEGAYNPNSLSQKLGRLKRAVHESGVPAERFDLNRKDLVSAEVQTDLKVVVFSRIEE